MHFVSKVKDLFWGGAKEQPGASDGQTSHAPGRSGVDRGLNPVFQLGFAALLAPALPFGGAYGQAFTMEQGCLSDTCVSVSAYLLRTVDAGVKEGGTSSSPPNNRSKAAPGSNVTYKRTRERQPPPQQQQQQQQQKGQQQPRQQTKPAQRSHQTAPAAHESKHRDQHAQQQQQAEEPTALVSRTPVLEQVEKRGGVQGLRWYAAMKSSDEHGDLADEFLYEDPKTGVLVSKKLISAILSPTAFSDERIKAEGTGGQRSHAEDPTLDEAPSQLPISFFLMRIASPLAATDAIYLTPRDRRIYCALIIYSDRAS
eukprot:gene11163-18777_t